MRTDCREQITTIMRNIFIICRKELRSYFVSPIAYLLLIMFALIFGFFFWNSLGYFVFMGMQSQMRGEQFPMNLNEQIVRPLLSNVGVIGLFFIPLISMRLFAEEKRGGTIELLATSIVPPRFSSANKRIEIKGMKNNPMTPTFDSSGRTICSLRFIGNCSPRICDCMPMNTK